MGNTIDDIRKKFISLSTVYEQYGLFDKNGVFASLFNSTKAQIIPEANLTKILSFDEASKQLEDFNRHVVQGGMSLDTYFKQYQNGNTILRNYVTTTEQQNQSTQGLIRASKEARTAQIAHNESIKAQTLSAKAGQVALKGLAMAGNMLAMWAFTKALQVATTTLDNYIHKVEKTEEAAKGFANSVKSFSENTASDTTTLSSLNKEYTPLSKGVNSLGQNVHLFDF